MRLKTQSLTSVRVAKIIVVMILSLILQREGEEEANPSNVAEDDNGLDELMQNLCIRPKPLCDVSDIQCGLESTVAL